MPMGKKGMQNKTPKIVFLDLETLPNLKEAIKVWPQLSNYPGQTLKATISTIICAGYKILGDKKVNCINAWDFKTWAIDVNDDKKVCESIYEILKDADGVVTHNGKRFDWKFLQTRLAFHNLDPLPTIKHADTCQIAKSKLLLFNNRLGTLAKTLTDDDKLDHGEGWDLWVKTFNRNKTAMRLMEKYCKQDVLVTEKVFKRLRSFTKDVPNYNLFSGGEKMVCPNCGSNKVKSEGWRATSSHRYRRRICTACGTRFQTNKKDLNPRAI